MSSSTLTTPSDSASACTNVETENFTFEWIIKNFKLLEQEKGECIMSPIFCTRDNKAKWKLQLFPQGNNKEDYFNYVSLFLQLHSYGSQNIKINVHSTVLLLPTGKTSTFVHKYETVEGYGFPRLIERSALLKACESDDTVTIQWKMAITGRTVTNPTKRMKFMEEAFDSQEGQLSQDFRLLYKASKLMDITILVGTRKFPAHKVVLAARSPVFSAMFEHKKTRENLEHELKIERMEPAVVEAMLEFLYTDEVTDLEGLAYGLLEAAEKYDLPRLRIMSEKALYKQLTKENAAKSLVYANLHRSFELKEHIMEFMTHHLVDVAESEDYKKMEKQYPELVTELMRKFIIKQQNLKQQHVT